MHPRKRLSTAFLGLLAAFAIALAGCAGNGAGRSGQPPVGEPRTGGSATLLMPVDVQNLDPAAVNNVYAGGSAVGNALYGQLVRNDDASGRIQPVLAESLTSTDGIDWTMKLRTGLTFSDGTPFDADAVRYNWERFRDAKVAHPNNVSAFSTVADLKVLDERTLAFRLTEPSLQFGQTIAGSALTFIASPKALAAGPTAFNADPVGAGPFLLKSWDRGNRIVLTRNPGYFDAPRPYLDELVVRADEDSVRRMQSLQAGDVDLAVGTEANYNALAEESGLVVTRYPLSGANFIMFNPTQPPFDDVRARQAVAAAIDPDVVNQTVYGGTAQIPRTLMVDQSPFHEADLPLPGFDKGKAQRLFDELAAEGRPVAFTVLGTLASDSRKVLGSVQAQLSQFTNVSMQVEFLEQGQWFGRLGSNSYQASVYGVLMLDPEPSLSQFLVSSSPTNFARVHDAGVDAALARGRTSADVAERKAAYREVQTYLAENAPFIAHTRPSIAMMSNGRVGGIAFYGSASPRVDGLWVTS